MSKYILISGSPRKGNTDYVLLEIYNNLKGDKELIFLKDINLKHCNGCLNCYETNECVINDKMSKVFKKLLIADIIIIGSPNYYGNVSGLLKDFIDRTIPSYETKSLKNKKLISIMVGGGETQIAGKFHKEAIKGFVKFNQLDLVKTFNFKAFQADDLKQSPDDSKIEIDKIVGEIENSKISGNNGFLPPQE